MNYVPDAANLCVLYKGEIHIKLTCVSVAKKGRRKEGKDSLPAPWYQHQGAQKFLRTCPTFRIERSICGWLWLHPRIPRLRDDGEENGREEASGSALSIYLGNYVGLTDEILKQFIALIILPFICVIENFFEGFIVSLKRIVQVLSLKKIVRPLSLNAL